MPANDGREENQMRLIGFEMDVETVLYRLDEPVDTHLLLHFTTSFIWSTQDANDLMATATGSATTGFAFRVFVEINEVDCV